MDPENKLGTALVTANLVGLVAATAFYLLGNILTGLLGFLVGLFGAVTLIHLKHENKDPS